MLAPAAIPLADQLKARTQDLHTRAERHPFQAALMRGQLGRAGLIALHAQLFLLHDALERHLAAARTTDPRLAAVVKDHHFRAGHLHADLTFLGVNPAATPAAEPTRRLIESLPAIARENPLWLLGALYVLEGSTNGAKYIMRAIQKATDLPGPQGLTYLDPHGEAQTERWQRFRADVNALNLQGPEAAAVIAAAEDTFQYMIDLFETLHPASP